MFESETGLRPFMKYAPEELTVHTHKGNTFFTTDWLRDKTVDENMHFNWGAQMTNLYSH